VSSRPDLLLVHGAWHGPWAWDALIPQLPVGEVRTVALPSSGPDPSTLGDFTADIDAVRAGITAGDGRDTVVVAHSYGGLPATEAVCGHPEVVGLVYVAAFVADAGHSVAELFDGGLPPWWDIHAEEGYVDPRDPEAVFYRDVPPALTRSSAERLGHQSFAVLGATLGDSAWRHLPTSYVVCNADEAVPPPLQERMAEHAVRIHHLPSSHSPMLSMPGELAKIIDHEIQEFTR
jgi:pimeloyl-ACP methyl ester carboxylesterase